MCDPATIMLAVSAASAVASYAQQQDAARKQEHAAEDNYRAQQEQLAQQQKQVNEGAAQQESERARAMLIEQGRLRVASGEAGVYGNSVDRSMNESVFNAGTDITTIENNRRNGILQTGNEANSLRAKAQGIVNTSNRPSALGTGLTIAGQVGGYAAKHPSSISTTGTEGATKQVNYGQMG